MLFIPYIITCGLSSHGVPTPAILFHLPRRALGVMAYTMMVGRPPFETAEVKTTYKLIRAGLFSFPDSAPLSAAARDLVSQLLRCAAPPRRHQFWFLMMHATKVTACSPYPAQ